MMRTLAIGLAVVLGEETNFYTVGGSGSGSFSSGTSCKRC